MKTLAISFFLLPPLPKHKQPENIKLLHTVCLKLSFNPISQYDTSFSARLQPDSRQTASTHCQQTIPTLVEQMRFSAGCRLFFPEFPYQILTSFRHTHTHPHTRKWENVLMSFCECESCFTASRRRVPLLFRFSAGWRQGYETIIFSASKQTTLHPGRMWQDISLSIRLDDDDDHLRDRLAVCCKLNQVTVHPVCAGIWRHPTTFPSPLPSRSLQSCSSSSRGYI